MKDVGKIERLYKKPYKEKPTEEELKIIKEGREEIKRGQYIKLEDALEILDE